MDIILFAVFAGCLKPCVTETFLHALLQHRGGNSQLLTVHILECTFSSHYEFLVFSVSIVA